MRRFAKAATDRGVAADSPDCRRGSDIYERHAGNLYRQGLFTLDDRELAEQVVADVLLEECVQPSAGGRDQDVGRRLAAAACRRCMNLDDPEWTSRLRAHRAGSSAGCAGPAALTAMERGVLGLVLFGGLKYRQVAADLGISARDVAAITRTALVKAANSEPGTLRQVTRERT